jgi:hypothetical protein
VHDLIIVPGGGLTAAGEVHPWVRSRLDRAVEVSGSAPILCLSAASGHKALPLDRAGKPLFEAVAGARYLMERGVEPSRILLEFASYDTIGNAFFARVMHTEWNERRRLLVVNSEFHMPRTEFIFRWVFGLAPDRGYHLEFDPVPNLGMPADALAFRRAHEAKGLERTQALAPRIATLAGLHRFLFLEHDLYSASGVDRAWETSPDFERVY